MNLYPSIRATMGSWTYYIIRMTMDAAATNIKFASEVWDDRTLDRAIQRRLDESRAKKEIVRYLAGQDDRFFSSIVVAAIGGHPEWFPLDIAASPEMRLLEGDSPLSDTFGVLRFDGKQKYYVLDGQHRLFAVKSLLKGDDVPYRPRKGFEDEELSVIVVVPGESESREAFLRRYRRLFGNLNRYAKPTDKVTNIIMDEDDVFAILTRRLVTDHEFFQAKVDRQKDSYRVKTDKGKNLRAKASHFTSLEALYDINIILLRSREQINAPDGMSDLKQYTQLRPDEDVIDALYADLHRYWDALIDILPDMRKDPPTMRRHNTEGSDSALFWPIGQELMARLARNLLDDGASEGHATPKECLRPLGKLNWNLHGSPWRNLVLVRDPVRKNWKIRSEDRKPAIDTVFDILSFQAGISPLGAKGQERLKEQFVSLHLPDRASEDERDNVEVMWNEIMKGCVRM